MNDNEVVMKEACRCCHIPNKLTSVSYMKKMHMCGECGRLYKSYTNALSKYRRTGIYSRTLDYCVAEYRGKKQLGHNVPSTINDL